MDATASNIELKSWSINIVPKPHSSYYSWYVLCYMIRSRCVKANKENHRKKFGSFYRYRGNSSELDSSTNTGGDKKSMLSQAGFKP